MYYFSKKGRNNIGKIFLRKEGIFKMRSLTVYLKNYKKESILAPFFKFLEVVFDLIVPIVIAQIIDVGIANHDNGYIVQRIFYSYTNGGSWSCQYHHSSVLCR